MCFLQRLLGLVLVLKLNNVAHPIFNLNMVLNHLFKLTFCVHHFRVLIHMLTRPARLPVPPVQPAVPLLDRPFFSRRTAHRTSTEGAVDVVFRTFNAIQCDRISDLHLCQLANSLWV
jgi:hypothetical protein